MSDSKKEAQKWVCDYCTYENFPSSIKCTMCKGSKPLLNEDIFRLSPPQTAFDRCEDEEPSGAVAVPCNSAVSLSNSKWSCKLCTYLNWPRSQHCVQCHTKRNASSMDIVIDCETAAATSPLTNQTNNIPQPMSTTSNTAKQAVSAAQLQLDIKNNENIESTLAAQAKRISPATSTTVAAAKSSPTSTAVANNLLSEQIHNLLLNESRIDLHKPMREACNKTKQDPCDSNAGAASNRLSPIEQIISPSNAASPSVCHTTHLNNLTNSSQNLQFQQQQSQQQLPQSPICQLPQQQQQSYVAKWACNTCTYENWPKSLKCSMCGDPRETGNIAASSTTAVAGSNSFLSGENEEHRNDTVSSNNSFNNKKNIYQLGSSETINNCDNAQERLERRQRQIRRQVDWQWLNACLGVVENNYAAVEAYLSCGGNPARSLTSTEIAALNRNSAFDVGHTLIHLAIRFHREEMLPMLLEQISGSGPGIKRVPSYVAPDLAADIRRHFANTLRLRKSVFNCHYVQEHATFALPAEIEELPVPIQEQLYEELLDRDAQKQLENPPPALNWSLEITARLGSRLLVLWNRSAGDCLLDSAMQATWGVFDRDNILRRALADSLHQCAPIFYTRWKEYEMIQASMLHFTLEEAQWQEDWGTLLSLASQPGASLEQLHIFALAHILRRPIVVYGVKYVKSFRGEDIGYARFEGLYLPLFWDQNFCIKSPIALGYTRGHFSALVPMEYARIERRDEPEDVTYLPLMDCESKLLPIHFLSQAEMGREEAIMRQWLDVCVTDGGLLVAQQKLRKRPLLVAQMLEEWLNHYRRIAQVITAPFVRRPQQAGYSSDGDSDEE